MSWPYAFQVAVHGLRPMWVADDVGEIEPDHVEVKFDRGHRFAELTISGPVVEHPQVRAGHTFTEPAQVPAWAHPLTIWGNWEHWED